MPQHRPEEMLQLPVLFSCNHRSRKIPTFQPFPIAGIYPHSCDTCFRNDNKVLENAILYKYRDEINRLGAIIKEKKRIKNIVNASDSPRFMTHMHQLKTARVQKMELEYQGEQEIKDVWRIFDALWPGLRT